ncbi:MAG: hypothetical protein PHZ19_06210 [Candidatus Thermoplasmatota archaeon]|nr:hypothetical protein [Candidatus Thermoplasmatota archaeon]
MTGKRNEQDDLIESIGAVAEVYFKDEDGNPLCLTPSQEDIVRKIVMREPKRMMVWATTRWGKSLAIAIGALIAAITLPGEKIRIIAPTGNLARVIMDYILKHLTDTEEIVEMLAIGKFSTGERLKQQLSKERITFKNGSEISILPAGIGSEGRALLGRGGTIIIVDEAESVPEELIRTHVMRMAGETPDAMVVLVSNPIYRGFMYNHMDDDFWHKFRIGWETALAEGRLTREFIEEQRENLTEEEFLMWYEAKYPDDVTSTLIKREWIEQAVARYADVKKYTQPEMEIIGVDIAAMGEDLTVMTHMEKYEGMVVIRNVEYWGKTEISKSVGRIVNYAEKHDITHFVVDDTGLSGIASLLREHNEGWNVMGINFGGKSISKNCANKKAEIYYGLRKLFQDGEIMMPDIGILKQQLNNLMVEFTVTGKVQVRDGQTKSPDFADSLALACYMRPIAEIGMDRVKIFR